jgi:type I restriction enzyme, S subunit
VEIDRCFRCGKCGDFSLDWGTIMKRNWKSKSIEQCFKVKSGDFLPAKIMVKDGNIDVYGGNGIAGQHNQYNLTGENIIIGRVGAKCGNVNRVEGAVWVTDNAFYISELTEEFDLHFLEHLLRKEKLRDKANQTAQPVISYTTIKNVILVIPPLSEQRRIVAIVDEAFESIDIAIENTKKNLINARELFESYLNGIFLKKGKKWIEKKLEDICSVKHGFAFKGEFFTTEESEYVLLTPGSFNESGGHREQGEKTKYYVGEIPNG